MRSFFIILLIGFLLLVFFQDLKIRRIHIALPLAIFCTSIYLTFMTVKAYSIILINSSLFLFIFVTMVGYMSIKKKKFDNPFNTYFGLGDFLYFISISPLFLSVNYLVFFIASLVFSMLIYVFFIRKKRKETIPLAGLSSLLLSLVVISDVLFGLKKITLL